MILPRFVPDDSMPPHYPGDMMVMYEDDVSP
jgi:hypothetical protein